MRRPFLPAVIALLVAAPALAAQLPLITAPSGSVRIELGGGFFPADRQWVAGTRQPLGGLLTTASLDARSTPLLADLASRIGSITGQSAAGFTLGGVTATAEHERGMGSIGLGYGVSSRLTLFATAPIVMVRSRYQLAYDPATANVGLNPSHPSLGNSAGQTGATTFFLQFDTALSTLAAKVSHGDFAGDPATLALAQQTLTDGSALRSALFTLLVDPVRAMPVLPTATSADGVALLGRIGTLRARFATQLGVSGFTAQPSLPDTPLTAATFNTLLTSPDGFGRADQDDRPRTALGDIEAGATYAILQRGELGKQWLSVWARGLMRFPNGTPAVATQLFSQATGDRQFDGELSGIVEFGHGAFGLRSELTYTHQFARVELGTVGGPTQLLLPTYRAAALSQDLGDILAITARPFYRMAPHLALSGMVSYWRKGSDHYAYATGQGEIAGASLLELEHGTAADALLLGLGLSYVHPGDRRDNVLRMPVEAGVSIERTIASGRGVFDSPLTTRMTFRVYKPIFRR